MGRLCHQGIDSRICTNIKNYRRLFAKLNPNSHGGLFPTARQSSPKNFVFYLISMVIYLKPHMVVNLHPEHSFKVKVLVNPFGWRPDFLQGEVYLLLKGNCTVN